MRNRDRNARMPPQVPNPLLAKHVPIGDSLNPRGHLTGKDRGWEVAHFDVTAWRVVLFQEPHGPKINIRFLA
jgi:hypothetical protein